MEGSLPEMKQILEQYFLLLSGKRPMKGNLDIASYGLKTSNCLLYEAGSDVLYLTNHAKTAWKKLNAMNLSAYDYVFCQNLRTGRLGHMNIYTYPNTSYGVKLWSYDGSWVNGLNMMNGQVVMPNLPLADPEVVGALWNDGGTVKVSSG